MRPLLLRDEEPPDDDVVIVRANEAWPSNTCIVWRTSTKPGSSAGNKATTAGGIARLAGTAVAALRFRVHPGHGGLHS